MATSGRGVRSRLLRDHFSELPQPAPFKPIESEVTDNYLKGLEGFIDALSAHILKIQEEEVKVTKQFSEALAQYKGKRSDNEEKARLHYMKLINGIRETRKQFREMLYDALQERRKLWDSLQIQKDDDEIVRRKMGKLHALPEDQQQKITRKGTFLDGYGILFFVFQVALIILFAATCDYPTYDDNLSIAGTPLRSSNYYTFYSNIALMVFIGFGYLGASYKKYGFSAIGYTFSMAAFSIQWSVLTLGFFQQEREARDEDGNWKSIQLALPLLIWGLYGATANIVALSSIFGRTSPVQQLLFSAVFIPFFSLNHWIGYHLLHALDLGGSIYIFTFGSFFGVLFSLAFSKRGVGNTDPDANTSSYESDLLSVFGTVFLWVLWPSFNAALAPDSTQHRTIINTVLALCTSVIFTFLTSRTLRGGKFNMSDIQRASIVGGIALASITSFLVSAGAAMVTGAVAGLISTVSLVHLQPLLQRKLNLQDSLSSVSVYLIPGLIGAIAGILAAAVAADSETIYGVPLSTLFPNHDTRQAGWNLLIVLITLAISGSSGLLFGAIFRMLPNKTQYYSDDTDWEVPNDFEGHLEIHEADEKKRKSNAD